MTLWFVSTLPRNTLIVLGFLLISSVSSGKEIIKTTDDIQILLGLENVTKSSPIVYEDVTGDGEDEAIVFFETTTELDVPPRMSAGLCVAAVLDTKLENVLWQKTQRCISLDVGHAGLKPVIRLGQPDERMPIITFSHCWIGYSGCDLELVAWEGSEFEVVGIISGHASNLNLMTMPDGERVLESKANHYDSAGKYPRIYLFEDGKMINRSDQYPEYFDKHIEKASELLAAVAVDQRSQMSTALYYLPVFRYTKRYEEGMQHAKRLLTIHKKSKNNITSPNGGNFVEMTLYGYLGRLLIDQGQTKKAFKMYLKSGAAATADTFKGVAGAHLKMGMYCSRHGKYDEAIQHFQKVKLILSQTKIIGIDLDGIDYMIKSASEPVRYLN